MTTAQPRLTRRAFLWQVGGCALVLGPAAAWGGDPVARWLGALAQPPAEGPTIAPSPRGAGPPAGTPPSLQALLDEAPIARFWTSTAQPGTACALCHDETDSKQRGIAPTDSTHQHVTPTIKCLLCARGCSLAEGVRGDCGARVNHRGQLRTLVYGRPVAIHVDPIEKKPFFHFLPGSSAYSLATAGCPLHCEFCQNWEISQARAEDTLVPWTPPGQIVVAAQSKRAPVIAFTYNEPTVFSEYAIDIAHAAREGGLRSVLVSCGYATEPAMAELCAALDAVKIDLKGFSAAFYRDVCHAELAPVLRSIRQVAHSGRHLELVNLVVPTLNDDEVSLRGLSRWVVDELGPDVPVHFTRFHPDYRLRNLPPTPVATLDRARAIAMEAGMHYAYVGNVPGHPGGHTYCPGCGKIVIRRASMFVEEVHVRDGACAFCGYRIAGVFR